MTAESSEEKIKLTQVGRAGRVPSTASGAFAVPLEGSSKEGCEPCGTAQPRHWAAQTNSLKVLNVQK